MGIANNNFENETIKCNDLLVNRTSHFFNMSKQCKSADYPYEKEGFPLASDKIDFQKIEAMTNFGSSKMNQLEKYYKDNASKLSWIKDIDSWFALEHLKECVGKQQCRLQFLPRSFTWEQDPNVLFDFNEGCQKQLKQ